MIDVKQGLRRAYFQALNNYLSYNGVLVPVSDEMTAIASSATLYVVITGQSGSQENTQQTWRSVEQINLDIVSKGAISTSKSPVDEVAGQILSILFPSRTENGLIQQPGIEINEVRLEDDRYLSLSLGNTNSNLRRILTFEQHILQK